MRAFLSRHRHIIDWLCTLVGIALYSLALDLFLVGNHIAAGGISGLAVVLSSVVPLSVGTMIFIMNVPILVVALAINGWRYTVGTIIASVLYSLTVQVCSVLPTITDDPLVASVFGGAIYGAGMSALAFGNGSTGGTDLISRLLVKKIPGISLGKMALLVDGCVVLFAIVAFRNIEAGLYAIITITVCSFTADRIMMGFDRGCLCMIITTQDPQVVSAPLMQHMRRAVTKVPGVGMYSSAERSVLFMAVRPQETLKVKEIVCSVDENAFVMVLPANEVRGGTFRTLMKG